VADAALVAQAGRLQEVCIGRRITVATAESCTGGLVAEAITSVSGSSAYFLGGYVTYADALKQSALGVSEALLAAHGAVSAEVAEAMAAGARERAGASLAVSVTGVAGPDGGTAAKPVGLVYLALATAGDVQVRRLQLAGDREGIRTASTAAALAWLSERAERLSA
jgi:PncC family amidohydrolase